MSRLSWVKIGKFLPKKVFKMEPLGPKHKNLWKCNKVWNYDFSIWRNWLSRIHSLWTTPSKQTNSSTYCSTKVSGENATTNTDGPEKIAPKNSCNSRSSNPNGIRTDSDSYLGDGRFSAAKQSLYKISSPNLQSKLCNGSVKETYTELHPKTRKSTLSHLSQSGWRIGYNHLEWK